MEISILLLSCAVLERTQKCLFFILLTTICNLNGFRQIKRIWPKRRWLDIVRADLREMVLCEGAILSPYIDLT